MGYRSFWGKKFWNTAKTTTHRSFLPIYLLLTVVSLYYLTYVRPTLHTIALYAASLTYLILSSDRNYPDVGIEHTTYDLHVQRLIRMANCSKLK